MTGSGLEAFGLDGDFTAAFLAARRVADLAGRDPASLSPATVTALEGLLARNDHARQTQARILYREAAGVLVRLLAAGPPHLAGPSRLALCRALETPGKPRLAAAEAVGGLPLPGLRGPHVPVPPAEAATLSCRDLLALAEAPTDAPARAAGRSLLFPTRQPDSLLVVKRLRQGEDPAGLVREAVWMEHCATLPFPEPCHVPMPCRLGEARLVAIPDLPCPRPGLDPQGRCLAYRARTDYFVYPNGPGPEAMEADALVEVLGRAAFLLGWLAGRGIVHEAAIPLFHNRVQRGRREDGGVYDWRLPGRLDKWLHSALHPNFGLSGLRDFEHLESVGTNTAGLYRRLGDHLVSLFLVAGSAFRRREPQLLGTRPDGGPVDARHLFDEALLARLVGQIVSRYHHGFVGQAPDSVPFSPGDLARRMVEEMGVDRYMTELLRVDDQQAMTDAEFVAFLVARGLDPDRAAGLRRGEADVELATGPHLGAFNNRTSLPELNESVAAAVAGCLAARHARERQGSA